MAPEVIMCETVKDSPYNYKADIWSFGQFFYLVITYFFSNRKKVKSKLIRVAQQPSG